MTSFWGHFDGFEVILMVFGSKSGFWGQKMKKPPKSPKLPEVFAILSGDFILEIHFFAFSKGGTQGFWKNHHFEVIFDHFLTIFDHFWSFLAQNMVLRVQITVIRGLRSNPSIWGQKKSSKSWFWPPKVRFFWPNIPGNPCRFWRSFLCLEKVRCNLQVYIYI